jgi:hypothetical protein
MRLIHYVGKTWNSDEASFLKRFNINVKEGKHSYIKPDVEVFEHIRERIMEPHLIHGVAADFTKEDLDNAEWVALRGLSPFGYPQPEETFDYIYDVYETSRYCEPCGIIDGPQENSFRIRSDRTKLLAFQLEWTYDEIFVERALYQDLFKGLGVGSRPAIIHRSGKESERFVQLDLEVYDRELEMNNFEFELCLVCHRKKYRRMLVDFLPPFPVSPTRAIFQGREFFGSGGSAFRLIYLTQELRRDLMDRKIARGHQFEPVMGL